jgi:hypothetical protein
MYKYSANNRLIRAKIKKKNKEIVYKDKNYKNKENEYKYIIDIY